MELLFILVRGKSEGVIVNYFNNKKNESGCNHFRPHKSRAFLPSSSFPQCHPSVSSSPVSLSIVPCAKRIATPARRVFTTESILAIGESLCKTNVCLLPRPPILQSLSLSAVHEREESSPAIGTQPLKSDMCLPLHHRGASTAACPRPYPLRTCRSSHRRFLCFVCCVLCFPCGISLISVPFGIFLLSVFVIHLPSCGIVVTKTAGWFVFVAPPM